MQSLPGWGTKIDEVSNNVYKVTLKDAFGRISETTGVAEREGVAQATGWAFDIEKQVSRNWSKFLFDLCSQEFAAHIVDAAYNVSPSQSWYVEMKDSRIAFDETTSILLIQNRTGNDWEDVRAIAKSDLTYADIVAFSRKVD